MKLVNLRTMKSLGLLLVVLVLSYSCADEAEPINGSANELDASGALYDFIINGLGFDPDDVVDYGDKYVAEGDIAFDKATYVIPADYLNGSKVNAPDVAAPRSGNDSESNGRTKHAVTDYLYRVHPPTVRDITVSIHSSIPTSGPQNIRPDITEAIQKWNSISCTDIRFRLVTGTLRGHIEIRDDGGTLTEGSISGRKLPDGRLEPDVFAETDFPSESNKKRDSQFFSRPGRTLKVNGNLVEALYREERNGVRGDVTGLIMHELGHAVGFRHTDYARWREGANAIGLIHIPGTADEDAASIFNAGIVPFNNFSSGDKKAIEHFYPKTEGTTCLAPLYYYWSPTLVDAFYTIQLSEKGSTEFWNYSFQTVTGFVHTSQVSGTIALHRYYNESAKDHALKTGNMGTGWRRERTYYIYPSSGTNRAPLYEFYNASRKDHYYGTSLTFSSGGEGYVNQGIVGYIATKDN